MSFIPVRLGAGELAILHPELEPQARDAAEFVVVDGCCPAANDVDVVHGDNDVEVVILVVQEAGLVAELMAGF